jgi:diguanylate cyclase (GGDEF)-like protein
MLDSIKQKILIVDDDRSNILVLNHILKPTYSTLAAISGEAAIEIAKTAIPDLILLDVIMPDMTGFETLSILKREDSLRRVPVIFITALDSTEDEEKGFALGAVDYITKPFHNSIVRARVKTHLQMMAYIREIEKFGKTDVLTGLPNRRSFNEQINIEWSRAMREKEPLSVLMIDIDDFKQYNDKHGHLQGDVLLQTIAGVFLKSVERSVDFIARWGGEEFIILLPNAELGEAVKVAERVRANVENTIIATISLGVNTEIPIAGGTIDEFIAKADTMLYDAKKTGKNKVCY